MALPANFDFEGSRWLHLLTLQVAFLGLQRGLNRKVLHLVAPPLELRVLVLCPSDPHWLLSLWVIKRSLWLALVIAVGF